MSDRPILFSAPMVRALLDGRKTKTRRIITPNNLRVYTGGHDYSGSYVKPDKAMFEAAFNNARNFRRIEHVISWVTDPAPHQIGAVMSQWTGRLQYAVGDRLWVREAWRADARLDKRSPKDVNTHHPSIQYLATDAHDDFGVMGKNRVSIHMPRWASRLTLNVIDARIERLHDISETDAIAEGIDRDTDGWRDYLMPSSQCCGSAVGSFQTLWDSINGSGAWKDNPWVAAYTFNVINSNIDKIEVAA